MSVYKRSILEQLVQRMAEPRRFLQVLSGPRQVGKTTLARQMMAAFGGNSTYATADGASSEDGVWIEQQWEAARFRCQEPGNETRNWLLVLDEVQKIQNWSETVKRLWDRDSADRLDLRVMLLGSSPLLVQQGLTESLAGRFEMLRVGHWDFAEMQDAFGLSIDLFLYLAAIQERQTWLATRSVGDAICKIR